MGLLRISRAEVARSVFSYLEQIFVLCFVHADPHPGNLFVHRWIRRPACSAATLAHLRGLGMVAIVPEESDGHAGCRLAVGTRRAGSCRRISIRA